MASDTWRRLFSSIYEFSVQRHAQKGSNGFEASARIAYERQNGFGHKINIHTKPEALNNGVGNADFCDPHVTFVADRVSRRAAVNGGNLDAPM